MKPSTIAIDGPAASGKSTLGYHLAKSMAYLYLDTGVLYRAVTWAVLDKNIPVYDELQVTALSQNLVIKVLSPTCNDERQNTVLVSGKDVTWDIRSPEVDNNVSPVSAYAGVREALTLYMRQIAARGHVVMVGRDIGTVVIPDADLKLYVTASPEERAFRRHQERIAHGKDSNYAAVLENIKQRDRIDSNRETAPLSAAPDAIILDTTHLTIQQMFASAERIIEQMVC